MKLIWTLSLFCEDTRDKLLCLYMYLCGGRESDISSLSCLIHHCFPFRLKVAQAETLTNCLQVRT